MVVQELPSGALLIYQSYVVSLVFIGTPISVLNFFMDNNLEAPMALISMISFVGEMMMHWR